MLLGLSSVAAINSGANSSVAMMVTRNNQVDWHIIVSDYQIFNLENNRGQTTVYYQYYENRGLSLMIRSPDAAKRNPGIHCVHFVLSIFSTN